MQPHVGSRFQLQVQVKNNRNRPVDLSGATVNFRMKDNNNQYSDVTPTKTNGGSDGRLDAYLTLTVAGRWDVQVEWSEDGNDFKSSIFSFGVMENV